MAWTSTKTFVAGNAITASDLNTYVSDNTDYLKDVLDAHGMTSTTLAQLKGALVGCKAVRTAAQSIANNTFSSIHFNETDEFDSDAFHDTSTNNDRVTIPTGLGGYYLMIGHTRVEAGGTADNQHALRIEKNGVDAAGTEYLDSIVTAWIRGSADTPNLVTSVVAQLSAGDYVALTPFNDGGSAKNFTNSYLTVVRLFGT